VDVSKLKLRDVRDFDHEVGWPITELEKRLGSQEEPSLSADAVTGLVTFIWLVERRDNPELTLDDVWDRDLDSLVDLFNEIEAEGGAPLADGSVSAARPDPAG